MNGCILVVECDRATRELLARIKAVMRRRTPQLGDDVIDVNGLRLDPTARRVSAGEHEIELWSTEFRMLHFFMGAKIVLTPREQEILR